MIIDFFFFRILFLREEFEPYVDEDKCFVFVRAQMRYKFL